MAIKNPHDYDRLRVLWPDHLGLARGKYIPWRLADRAIRHCTGVWALGYDREMTPTPGSHMLEGLPDMEASFDPADARPGWELGTAVVVADLSEHGAAVDVSPRAALKRAVEQWKALGYTPKIGVELEAYVLTSDGRGGWQPLDVPGGFVYGTGPTADPTGLIDDIWNASEAMGLKLESLNTEYDTPQFEFTLEYDDALAAADAVFLFKTMAREVAQRKGLLLTFLGKPINGKGGSGTHFNLSVSDKKGNNAIADPKAADGLSSMAKHMIGGLLAHHEALSGLLAPTVNAYKRLRPASLSGYWANWGYDHRGATVRVPPERGRATRLEHRMGDGAVPVHIGAAAVLRPRRGTRRARTRHGAARRHRDNALRAARDREAGGVGAVLQRRDRLGAVLLPPVPLRPSDGHHRV
jgi:glutamine synthetase